VLGGGEGDYALRTSSSEETREEGKWGGEICHSGKGT